MAVILSLETSTDICSVALHDGGKLLSHAQVRERQAHAAELAPLIERVLREASVAAGNVGAVAVSAGPGSYTGLRIGTSTAKGLCFAGEIPLIAVSTLALLSFQAQRRNTTSALLCPMIDARRMEVYCMVVDAALNTVRPVAAEVVDEHSFSELLQDHQVLFFGNGAEKCREVIAHRNALFLSDIFPDAMALGEMASKKFDAGAFEDVVHFEPFYLKEFVAKKSEKNRPK